MRDSRNSHVCALSFSVQELELGYDIQVKKGKVPIKKAQFTSKNLAYQFFKSDGEPLIVEPAK